MTLELYGASFCPGCKKAKKYLEENNIEHNYINVEEEPDKLHNMGLKAIPVLYRTDLEKNELNPVIGFDQETYEELITKE